MLGVFNKAQRDLVISQSDIDEALKHLNSLPGTITKSMPKPWGQLQFLAWLSESLPKKVNIGDCISVATGIYGHIVPVGYEFANAPHDERLQVALSIRKWHTDMQNLLEVPGRET
jgi:hypothetical protein